MRILGYINRSYERKFYLIVKLRNWKKRQEARAILGRKRAVDPKGKGVQRSRNLEVGELFTYGCLGNWIVRDHNPHIFSLSIMYLCCVYVAKGLALNHSTSFEFMLYICGQRVWSKTFLINSWAILYCFTWILLDVLCLL